MKNLVYMYVILILLVGLYLVGIENIGGGGFNYQPGGRDLIFSFYDISLFLVLILASALTVISVMAYGRKKSGKLLLISTAFFFFAVKSALKLIDNFYIGHWDYIGISIQTLEFVILLLLFYALFRK